MSSKYHAPPAPTGTRKDATERALAAWIGGLADPATDGRSVAEIVGPEVWALAQAEAARLAGRPLVGPVDWARVGAAAEGAA